MKKYEIQVVALQEIKHARNEITNFRKCTMFLMERIGRKVLWCKNL